MQEKQRLVYIVTGYLQPLNGKNKLKSSLYCLRLEPSDTDSNQTPPTWPLLCLLFWARRTLCTCVRYSHLLPHSVRTLRLRSAGTCLETEWLNSTGMQGEFHCTLKGPRQQDLVLDLERVTGVPPFLKLIWNKDRDLKGLILNMTKYSKHLHLHSLNKCRSRFSAKPDGDIRSPWQWICPRACELLGSQRHCQVLVCATALAIRFCNPHCISSAAFHPSHSNAYSKTSTETKSM